MLSAQVQNSKAVITTAVITAVTTIAVSFIGVVPQLRSGDKGKLDSLEEQVKELKKSGALAGQMNGASGASDKRSTIRGTVRTPDGSRLLSGYDVYLLPEGNNLLTAKTDDTGTFIFNQIPSAVYSIIVRDSANGKSGKGLLDADGDEVQVIGAKIRYRIQ